MNFLKLLFLVVFSFIGNTILYAQSEEVNSLEQVDLNSLKGKIFQPGISQAERNNYIEAYLLIAKGLKNNKEIARGYYFKTLVNKSDKVKEQYYDSILEVSKNEKNSNFPTVVYLDKGSSLYNQRKLKEALDHYLLALELNKGDNKENLEFLGNRNIALLKSRIGFNKEALELLQKCWKFTLEKDFKTYDPKNYLSMIGFLSHSFRKNGVLDSANYYNKKGLNEAQQLKDDGQYFHFVLNDGVISYFEDDLESAKDSLEKGLEYYVTASNNLPNLAVGNYYLGKVMSRLGHTEDALNHFKEVDTVFQLNRDILPETREAYRFLTNYYKSKNDLQNELVYIEKLITVDSVLNDNYKFLSENISKKFDTPKLLEQKEAIINKLNNKNSLYAKYIYWVLGIAVMAISFGFFQYYRKRAFSKRFEELLNNYKTYDMHEEPSQRAINIPNDIVQHIMNALDQFEKKHHYLDSKINLVNLAKEIGTNTSYLSKTVNYLKDKNFSSYLNELRVKYAFIKLKEDLLFRNYTIKAIAFDVGFKNAESFSKAFYKHYKIYPSFYIRSLNKLMYKSVK